MLGRPPGWPVLAVLLLAAPAVSAAPSGGEIVPPPDRDALGPRAPTPGWDIGLLAGVCGVGQSSVWQGTEFCGALLADVFWLRKTRQSTGFGAYARTGTAGFYDFRASVGPSLHVPLSQIFSGGLRAGPLVHVMGDAAAPGFAIEGEFGIRALNHSGRYTLTHMLVVGWEQSFGEGSRVGGALTIALRVDAFWFAAPLGMLF